MDINRNTLGPILLTLREGNFIKGLIRNHYQRSQAQYAEAIGMKPPNLSNYLAGTKPLTVELLQKILSGINYSAVCQVTIQLHPLIGQDAQNAPFTPLEDM